MFVRCSVEYDLIFKLRLNLTGNLDFVFIPLTWKTINQIVHLSSQQRRLHSSLTSSLSLVRPVKAQNDRGTNPLQIVPKEELFDLFEVVHAEGGKHLGRDRLFADLKSRYTGFSRSIVLAFVNSCQECQLQKSRKSLKNIITHPIRSQDFASRGQVDLIDFQASNEVNLPYNFLLVYQDHLTKFIVLRPLKRKTAEEVVRTLMDIFCLIGSPHILQSDNGREFKNINLATMIRELWPGDIVPEPSIPLISDVAPTHSKYTSFNHLYPPISHTQSQISSESSLTPPVDSGILPVVTDVANNRTELACIVCKQACSDAHRCPGCHQSIHVICGNSAENMEGYGCPVWCQSCLLEERSNTVQEGRRAAKRGQAKRINRMIHQSNKRIKLLNIGENVLLPIPEVDKRSPFDPQNLPGVVLSSTDDGFYQIGTSSGRLENHYTAGQLELSLSFFLRQEDVPDKSVTLREAILHSSLGIHKQFCNCTGGCVSNICKCKRSGRTCSSKCHKALTCHNKSLN